MKKTADQVWSRAAMNKGGVNPRAGDAALSALLLAHGMVMNGGVLHAVVDVLQPDQLVAARDGFRFFGFGDVAELLELASRAKQDSESEALFDSHYGRLIGNDSVLVERFERNFAENPDLYAPLAGESREAAHPELAKNLDAMHGAALEWKRRR